MVYITAHADSEVGKSELPEWVKKLEIEEFAKDRNEDLQQGIAHLLSDRQIRKTADGHDFAERHTSRIVDRSGLEAAAQISHSFDPESTTLSFNFVRILRDGDVLERLDETEITLLRQEEGLSSGLITGNITALIELEDVRVGDVIDYSISGSVNAKLWPDEYFESVALEWSVPVAQMHFSLAVPENVQIEARSVATDIKPQVTVEDGWKHFRLQVFDPDPKRVEQNIPADLAYFGFIVFTTMNSWSDVADWAVPLFSVNDPLPDDFRSKLDEIAETYSLPQDRATYALRLVQEDIRYVGLEIGLGSHVPRSPTVTVERGFGDCKDKSVLLVAALDYLGIEARPALASLFGGHMLPQMPPAIGVFDHVIVEISIDEQKLWVDPTLSHQGGNVTQMANLGYGYVLPIRDKQSELVKLDLAMPELPTVEIRETFEYAESENGALRITSEEVYREELANVLRRQVSGVGKAGLRRGYFDYYAGIYDGLAENQPLHINDDLDENVITFRAEFEVDAEALRLSDYNNNLPVYATAVQQIIPRQVEAMRTSPIRLSYGTNSRHVISILTPGRQLAIPKNKSESAGGVSYSRNFRREGDKFEMELTLVVSEKVAALSSAKALTSLADVIAEDSKLNIRVGTARPHLSKQLGIDTPMNSQTVEAIELARSFYSKREYTKTLTILNRLISENEDATQLRGYLQQFKGTVLIRLGRDRAAEKPFAEGFDLYEPNAIEGYFSYIGLLGNTGQDAQTVKMIARMLENHPASVSSLNMDWMFRFARHLRQSDLESDRELLVLAIATSVRQSDDQNADKFGWAIMDAIEVLSQADEPGGAADLLPYLKNPEDLADLLSGRESEAIWNAIEQEAGENLSKAIDSYVAYTKEAADADPENYEVLTRHLAALRAAGKFSEAVDFAEPIVENWAQIEAVGEDAYWFVNEYTYALSDAAYPDRAQAVIGKLVELGVYENADLISMAINRAQLLLHWGDFEATLIAVQEIENLEGDFASDYGWMWVYHAKVCALYQLNRKDEALDLLSKLIDPISDSNASAFTKTMLCVDKLDKAAESIVGRLHDPDDMKTAISSFYELRDLESVPTFMAELQRRAQQVRARPEVREALDKVGRILTLDVSGSSWISF